MAQKFLATVTHLYLLLPFMKLNDYDIYTQTERKQELRNDQTTSG